MREISTVIEDINKVMQSKDYEGNLQKIAEEAGNDVTKAIVNSMESREKKPYLRMSSIGRCERAQWYDIKGYTPEEIDGSVYLTFLQGHVLEAMLVAMIKLSGHEVTGQQKKHEVEGINGSQDCCIDGELVDIKTASDWSWKNKFSEDGIKEDVFGYIKQLSAYGKNEDRDTGYFLALNKNKSTLKLCKQELEKDVDKHITQLKDKMELDTPPMRLRDSLIKEKTGGLKLCMTCAFCGFKEDCYGKLNSKSNNGFTRYYVDTIGGDF